MENIEQGGDEGIKQQRPTNPREQKRKKDAIVNIIFALLTEAALILWISSEFFNGVERPFAAFGMLFLSIALLAFYTAHKLVEFKRFRKHERHIYFVCTLCCAVLFLVFYKAFETYSEKIQLANEPKVFPSRVELHDGNFDKLTRVLISNPSDSWIYQLTLMIEVESNSCPIVSVRSTLADSKGADTFEEKSSQPQEQSALSGPWLIPSYIQADFVPDGRLCVLQSMAPKEIRALWIRGTYQANSYAKILIADWKLTPLSLNVDYTNNRLFLPMISKTSAVWRLLPNNEPMDFDFSENPSPTPGTNNINPIPLPMKPFRGIQLQ
jgi:hypothetical protein